MTTETRVPPHLARQANRAARRGGPSENDIFLAKNQPTPVTAQEVFHGKDVEDVAENSPVELGHTNAGRVRMWRITPSGSRPVWLNRNSLADAIKAGDSPVCHDCGGDHGEAMNDCPGRAIRPSRPCPVCFKPLYDPKPTGVSLADARELPPGTIIDDKLGASTPETRTYELARRHVAGFHKDDLQMYFPGTPADFLGTLAEAKG